MAELLFSRGGVPQLRAPLRDQRVVLGRSPEADFVLPDTAVSRRQCAVTKRDGGWFLVDLSGRGTRVSDRLADAQGTPLRDGDEIVLGPFVVSWVADPRVSSEVTAPSVSSTKANRASRGQTVLLEPSASRTLTAASLRLHQATDAPSRVLDPSEGSRVVIGSAGTPPECVVVEDPHVSAAHCQLSFRGGRWLLEDLGSTNGTWVDGVRILSCVLSGNATIRVGETTLGFQAHTSSSRHDEPLPGMVSRDPALHPVIELVRRVAPTRAAVAIHGETGTGKEVVARAVHLLSERSEGPFVALNCGAISRDTVESELFGHEKGAFTGAERSRPGAFEEAHEGTLFLDEIGDLPLNIQVKLLRVLERGELRRLGGTRTSTVDVRIVSATHVDLLSAVEQGRFREDLFYRLCVVPVELPPLRRRVLDIVPLAERFAEHLSPGAPPELSAGARARLESHAWPGNARELRNVMQTALLMRSGPVLTEGDIRFPPTPRHRRRETTTVDPFDGKSLQELEQEAIRRAIERHQGDRRKAQAELGIARSTFFRKLDELGITRTPS